LPYFLRAVRGLPADYQVVLCAGAPDTAEIAEEVTTLVDELRTQRGNVHLITEMLPRHELTQILTHATTFVCPSVYEPLGIVNLEAMACGIPVVASATAGSRRSWPTGRPVISSRSTRSPTAPAPRSTRRGSSPTRAMRW